MQYLKYLVQVVGNIAEVSALSVRITAFHKSDSLQNAESLPQA